MKYIWKVGYKTLWENNFAYYQFSQQGLKILVQFDQTIKASWQILTNTLVLHQSKYIPDDSSRNNCASLNEQNSN